MKHCEEDPVLYPPLLPSKVDLRQVTIIPHNEWERIRDSLDSLTREAACLRAERKAKKDDTRQQKQKHRSRPRSCE